MATAATSLLGLALPVTGELQGTWGDTVNNSITSLLDTAVAGTTTLSTDGDVTLTTTTLASNQARQAILLCSGARTALRTITAPAQSKIYTIINATTGGFSVKLVGVGPTTGLTIPNGASAVVAWNGSDFIEIGSSTVGNLTVNGNLTVTGTSTLTGAATLTANPTLSGGTANGVAYLNGSKVLTTGSALTFDGSAFQTSLGTGLVTNTKQLVLNNFSGEGVGITFSRPTDSTEVNAIGTASSSWELGLFGREGIVFATGGGSTYSATTEQMRLTSTGLGIGTSSPSNKLQVNGNLRVEGATSEILMAVGAERTISASGSASSTALTFKRWNGSTYVNDVVMDGSGNLGLGVTPSAWGTFDKVLQVGAGSLVNYQNTDNTFIGSNTYYGGSPAAFRYITSSQTATAYRLESGVHKWLTAPSGTAGASISFTQAMTLDASGNLGIGTSSPTVNLHVYNASSAEIRIASANIGLQLYSSEGAGTSVIGTYTNHALIFRTNATERARIDSSGNLLVGKTASNAAVAGCELSVTGGVFTRSGGDALLVNRETSDGAAVTLRRSNTTVGTISVTTTATAYNTSSDYRLKHDIAPMTGALAKVAALKPVTYKWNADNSDGEGFIAHELAEVVPHAVTGEKDAVDEEGNPVYQGIDTSFLVATLTAAIQELKAEFDAYKATHP